MSRWGNILGFRHPKNGRNADFADDPEISELANPYVQLCRDNGIFKGDDKGNFNPKGNCTMEEVIAVALRAYEEIIKAQTAK